MTIDSWGEVFGDAFERRERYRVRNFVSTALEVRNATSHLSIPLRDNEVLRYLDAIHEVLRAVKAPGPENRRDEAPLRGAAAERDGHTPGRASCRTGAAIVPTAPTSPEPTGTAQGKALRPWIEVALPHPDVLKNHFKQAEFAADLFVVDSGNAEGDYATPRGFFGITFLTEELKDRVVLENAIGDAGQTRSEIRLSRGL